MINQIEEAFELSRYNDNKFIKQISEKAKVKPEHVTLGVFTLAILLLIMNGIGQKLVLLTLSFLYPMYKSFKALETIEDHDNKRWLIYWTVFGFVFAFRPITDYILNFLPFKMVIQTALFFVLYCPLTNGYEHVYNLVIRPLLKTYESKIDKYVQLTVDELKNVAKAGKKTVIEKVTKSD